MKRLHFIYGMIAAVYELLNVRRRIAATPLAPHRRTWAEHVNALSAEKGGRRYQHWIQMRICHGEYDHLRSSDEAARRRRRCAKICGVCRHIYSLDVWPDPNYRQPSQCVLNALEDELYYD